ncbi:hypothetical protein EIP91_010072 [Steccherinum ochraceum]|uniref:Uncharacterized protein n=1 Tax=Steccherinum ochraceum TaxID=92696 RepID=A0A4R0R0X0_9APHY|nr:hypothetical protein EIP91_010072 [Steccherinum ochraceum]
MQDVGTMEQLSADVIRRGLVATAAALHAQGRNPSIVVVGGAISTMYLHSRPQTHDVDFMYETKARNEDVTRIVAASERVRHRMPGVSPGWLNNHTTVYMTEDTVRLVYAEAMEQDIVVFRAPGLTVYAAPWRYALLCKLDRWPKHGSPPYDMKDAVRYRLEQLNKIRIGADMDPPTESVLKSWAAEYKLEPPSDRVLKVLKARYRKKYRTDGIIEG